MFILRKITGRDNVEMNFNLGDDYTYITKEINIDEFNKLQSDWNHNEEIYAFIVYKSGAKTLPLYRAQKNYMMTADGSTFSNLTLRN